MKGDSQASPEIETQGQGIPRVSIWDAVVVGAGPAGAMAAYELSTLGRTVLLLDRQSFPRWKTCGATLSPGVAELLSQAGLGNLLRAQGATPLHTLRLGGWSLRADLPLNGSVALSRSSMDGALIQAAILEGAVFRAAAKARLGPLLGSGRIVHVTAGKEQMEILTRSVVAADGLGSGLMAQAGAPGQVPASSKRRLVGLGGAFPPAIPGFLPGVVHMALGEAGYVGLVRVEDEGLNLAAAVDPKALREAGSPAALLNSILLGAGWPTLSEPPPGGWKGTPELTRRPVLPGAERLFAVGDAGGYVEPFTGEGMFWALSGARALAPIVARVTTVWDPGLLQEWRTVHKTLLGPAQRICRATSWTLARPLLSRNLIRVLGSFPQVADPVIRRVGTSVPSLA